MKFVEHNARPEGIKERSDCFIRAMTKASGLPYEQVHKVFKASGRPDRRGTPWHAVRHGTPALLGAETQFVMFDYHYESIGNYWSRQRRAVGRPTLAQFAAEHKTGRYVIVIRSHAFAMIDGVQYDTAKNGTRSRVMGYIKIPEAA